MRNWTWSSVSFWHLTMLLRSAPIRCVTKYLKNTKSSQSEPLFHHLLVHEMQKMQNNFDIIYSCGSSYKGQRVWHEEWKEIKEGDEKKGKLMYSCVNIYIYIAQIACNCSKSVHLARINIPQTTRDEPQIVSILSVPWYYPSCQTSALGCLGASAHQWHHSINKFKDTDFSCMHAGTVSQMATAMCTAQVCSLPSHWWNPALTRLAWDVYPDVFLTLVHSFPSFAITGRSKQSSLCDNEEGAGQRWGRKSKKTDLHIIKFF